MPHHPRITEDADAVNERLEKAVLPNADKVIAAVEKGLLRMKQALLNFRLQISGAALFTIHVLSRHA